MGLKGVETNSPWAFICFISDIPLQFAHIKIYGVRKPPKKATPGRGQPWGLNPGPPERKAKTQRA